MNDLHDTILVARYSLREALRRHIFIAAVLLALAFVTIYGIGLWMVFRHEPGNLTAIVPPTLFGLGLFGIHFLGAALAVFLCMSAVTGDAERGLLQQIIVRPLSRPAYLAGRLAGALALACAYIAITYACTYGLMSVIGNWTPTHAIMPLVFMLISVAMIALTVTTGSIWLGAAATGILAFMVIGVGMFGGLLSQASLTIAHGGSVHALGTVIAHIVPSEMLYQGALYDLSRGDLGLGGAVVRLGPFGGSQAVGAGGIIFVAAYAAVLAAIATFGFWRRDL